MPALPLASQQECRHGVSWRFVIALACYVHLTDIVKTAQALRDQHTDGAAAVVQGFLDAALAKADRDQTAYWSQVLQALHELER